jgi:hypothetical protein
MFSKLPQYQPMIVSRGDLSFTKTLNVGRRVVGSPLSCRHPLVMAMQTADLCNFHHLALPGVAVTFV